MEGLSQIPLFGPKVSAHFSAYKYGCAVGIAHFISRSLSFWRVGMLALSLQDLVVDYEVFKPDSPRHEYRSLETPRPEEDTTRLVPPSPVFYEPPSPFFHVQHQSPEMSPIQYQSPEMPPIQQQSPEMPLKNEQQPTEFVPIPSTSFQRPSTSFERPATSSKRLAEPFERPAKSSKMSFSETSFQTQQPLSVHLLQMPLTKPVDPLKVIQLSKTPLKTLKLAVQTAKKQQQQQRTLKKREKFSKKPIYSKPLSKPLEKLFKKPEIPCDKSTDEVSKMVALMKKNLNLSKPKFFNAYQIPKKVWHEADVLYLHPEPQEYFEIYGKLQGKYENVGNIVKKEKKC